MLRKFQIVGIAGALIFSAVILTDTIPSNPPPLPEPIVQNISTDSVEVVATNFEKPWSITFADERIFVSEKSGKIKIITSSGLLETPLITLRTPEIFGGGLLGITTHPDFSNNHFLYAYYTYEENEKLWNKIIRITEEENKASEIITILDKIPGSAFSNGGVIKFGPDGKLYVGTGTVSDESHLPQDITSLSGKILRLNDDGSIPNDNPFTNSPVYSLGHRHPQGMTWDDNDNLFVAEFGPEKNDEINLIKPGKNYGWPEQQCSGSPDFENAILCYDPSIEPGGILFYSGDKIDFESKFIMASMRASNLYQVDFEDGLSSQKSILSGNGRIRDVVEGNDGSIYVITSNTDGKGFPDGLDDRLLRILK